MEINELQKLVLIFVLVGMILGVGVLVLDNFSTAARDTTAITQANVNASSGSVTLSQTYCIAITGINNAANATTYAVDGLTAVTKETCTYGSSLPTNSLFNVSYTYGASTEAATATTAVSTAVGTIGSTWMSLIITVAILAIILTLVISSFAGKR